MKNNWENLERKFLKEEEIEYIKNTIINPNILKPETQKWLSWRGTLERKVLLNKANPEEIQQYERLREIEAFIEIICDNFPEDINELSQYLQTTDEKSAEFAARIMMETTFLDVEDAFLKKEVEKVFETEYEQDINEPFIEDLINSLLKQARGNEKYVRLNKMLESANFQHIDDETFLSISYLILKEIKNAENGDKRLSLAMRKIDKNNLAYLVFKNLRSVPIVIEEEPKNIYAEHCPADSIREYIENIINSQKRYLDAGKEIPQELLIPQEIVVSPQNIDFLLKSKLVDYIGAGETGNEIQFYWKKTEKLPALEVRVEKREDGKFILSYIKEEASEEKQEFIWDKKTERGKKGTIVVSKKQDALEDIYDMDR